MGLMLELWLEPTVCILLGSFMSSEQGDLVRICNAEGSNKGQQRGFLKDPVAPEDTYEMTGNGMRERQGQALGESQGIKL